MCGDSVRLAKVFVSPPRRANETLRPGMCGKDAVRVRRWGNSYSIKCLKQKEHPHTVVVHLSDFRGKEGYCCCCG